MTVLVFIRALVGIKKGLQSVDPPERAVGGESEELRSEGEEESKRENEKQENNHADQKEWYVYTREVHNVGIKEPSSGDTTSDRYG